MTHATLFPSRNSLSPKVKVQMVDLLNQILADALDLYSHTKQAHWNMKGPQFIQIHLLLDTLAEKLEKQIDEIAERATALGGVALGTSRVVADASRLQKYPLNIHAVEDHLQSLAVCYGHFSNWLRESIHQADSAEDDGTADLFTQCLREADKALWILESHLITEPQKGSNSKVIGIHTSSNRIGKRLAHH